MSLRFLLCAVTTAAALASSGCAIGLPSSAEVVTETLARGILQAAGGAMPRSAECLLALAAAEHLTECLVAAGFVVLRGVKLAGSCRDPSRPRQESLALRNNFAAKSR